MEGLVVWPLLQKTRFLGIWRFMKTTLDLPDGLMREVKIRAIHEHKKLKDAIAEFIRKGMAAGKKPPCESAQAGQAARWPDHDEGDRSGDRVGPRLGDAPR